jgi:hypothetical protein
MDRKPTWYRNEEAGMKKQEYRNEEAVFSRKLINHRSITDSI